MQQPVTGHGIHAQHVLAIAGEQLLRDPSAVIAAIPGTPPLPFDSG